METGVKTMADRRRVVEMVVLVVLVAFIGGWLWTRRTPHVDGRSYQVTADCTDGWCSIRLGSSSPDTLEWVGEVSGATPPGWTGHSVSGTLRIVNDWSMPSATFESGGTTVDVYGGKPDGHHGFAA